MSRAFSRIHHLRLSLVCKLVEDGVDPILLGARWRLMDLIGPVIGMLMAFSRNARTMVNGRHIRNHQEAAGDLRLILSGACSSEQNRRSKSGLPHHGANTGTAAADIRLVKAAPPPAVNLVMVVIMVRGLKTYH